MEYLNPIKQLEQVIRRYQLMILALVLALGISIIAVPTVLKGDLCSVVEQEGVASLVRNRPWKLSALRIEGVTKAYLSARFDWHPDTFTKRLTELKALTSDPVFSKLKDSEKAFEILSQNQKAVSFYIFEGFGFSNSKKQIEARITRVLRIRNAAVATPLVVRLSYEEAAISEENPYGLVITGVDEAQTTDTDGASTTEAPVTLPPRGGDR